MTTVAHHINFPFRATRLAPSPTGALHLGHARTFLFAWWLARQSSAKILMRMDDLDLSRAKPDSIQQAYDDLHWLGMDWDEGETLQSHRRDLYAAALQTLREKNLIYPCTCTRADIAAAVAASAGAPHLSDPHVRYPGTCAHRSANDIPTEPYCWRMRAPDETLSFQDLAAGPHSINVAHDSGDFPLTRFDATPAYQLACTVDDHAMHIDLVLRGDDLLSSTPRQLLLYRALNWTPPQFAHVPLVIGPDGKRLAKRHGESRIAQFRTHGTTPHRLTGWLAWRSNQLDRMQDLPARDLIPHFNLAKVPSAPIIMTPEDLAILTTP